MIQREPVNVRQEETEEENLLEMVKDHERTEAPKISP
jgi:hypothetical protein